MKKIIIAAAIAVAVFVGLQFMPQSSGMTRDQVEAEILAAAGGENAQALYATLQEKFPDEYAGYLDEMTAFANQEDMATQAAAERGFLLGQQFTSNLRVENARYMMQAPVESIDEIRAANVAIMRDLSDSPLTCATYALTGGAGFTLADTQRLDMELIAASADAVFRAMAAGRDTPVTHADVSDADMQAVAQMWTQLPDVTPQLQQALFSGDVQNPLACAANLSFEEFLTGNSDPLVQRVSVHLALIAAGL